MDEKALGRKLQLARKRAGLTQQDLCNKANLAYSTLAKIERGAIKSPSVFTVASIATATNTPLEQLLDIPGGLKPPTNAEPKKVSKTGVKFVYLDINGTLVRFLHRAFTEIAQASSRPPDYVETIFWRYRDEVNRGQLNMKEFNSHLANDLELENFEWQPYYLNNVEKVPGIEELVKWIAHNYEIGLITNSMPGSIDDLRQRGFIPNINYSAVVDSSKVGSIKPETRIYEYAQELAAVEPKEILLIDDTRPNLTQADKAGWQVLWFDEMQPEESIERVKQSLEF